MQSSQPCRIRCPEMIEKLTAMQDKYARDVGKVHSIAGDGVPEMLVKLTAMQDRMSRDD